MESRNDMATKELRETTKVDVDEEDTTPTNLPSHQHKLHKLQTPLINNSLTRSHTLQTKQIGRLTNKFINYLKLHLY